MKKSWKTTIGGLLIALGQGLQTTKPVGDWSDPIGQIITMVGAIFLGFSARDNTVTSEDAGAK